jgi:hypothetical protein
MSVRRLIIWPALAAICGLVSFGSPAFADKIYYPGISIGEPGSGPGQLKEPFGVAVNNETKDIYVVDKGNKRVDEFNEEGAFVTDFAPPGGFEDPEQIAIDNSTSLVDLSSGFVYVTDTSHADREVIDKFDSTGEYEGHITEAEVCEPENGIEECGVMPFASLRGIAVDAAGDLWIYQAIQARSGEKEFFGFMDEFADAGEFVQTFVTPSYVHNDQGLAVDSKDNLYTIEDIGKHAHEIRAPSNVKPKGSKNEGENLGTLGQGGANAVAVVPSESDQLPNGVLVDTGDSIVRYGPFGELYSTPLEVFPGEDIPKNYEGLSESHGLAANASATVYASELAAGKVESFNYVSVPVVITEPPSNVSETGLTLHGSVDPEGEEINKCYFEYGTKSGEYAGEAPCQQNPSGKNEPVQVSAELSALPPAETRSFRLVAVTGKEVRGSGQGLTIARPVTADETASEVGSATARVSAQVNAGGLASCYWIEYGTSTLDGERMPKEKCISVGVGEKIGVSAEVGGLMPNTRYYFRVGASNALGPKFGEGGKFVTFGPSAAELPDGRVAEAVSVIGEGNETEVYVPHGMEGTLDDLARHGIFTNRPFQASADGDTVTYVGDPPPSGGNGNEGVGGGNQYVATRYASGGWTPGVSINASGYANDYDGFSDDLSVGILGAAEPPEEVKDAPAGYANLYRRSISWRPAMAGSLELIPGALEPLFTTSPCLLANEFGSLEDNALAHELIFDGGNGGTVTEAAFTHLLFEADAELPSSPPAEACPAGNDLYDWFGGWRYLVNVLPNGRIESSATLGRQGPSKNGFVSPETSNAISLDGSRIYWSAVEAVRVGGEYEEQPKALYVRENDTQTESEIEGEQCVEPAKACTVQVDASALPGTESEKDEKGGRGQFWRASSDGSKVFFTDEKQLTAESTAEAGKPDLYEYDLEAPEGERLGDLSMSAKPDPSAHADVQGVVGTSNDGAYVYFVANGVLAEGAALGDCDDKYEANQTCSLYVRDDGVTKFIATLSGEDGDFTHGEGGNDGDWQADPGHRTAEVTPDGHSMMFMSRRPLTGYDNMLEGVPLTEVFVYDTETDRIACASCNPSGEPPIVPSLPEYAKNLAGIWGSFLPVSDSLDDYQPRLISEDGDRVFFDSIEPLVPQDENGLLDVYEWEAQGEGSCREPQGCVYVLSGGQSTDNSYLIDASANGNDVFFVSRAQLVKTDHGDNDVLYDARIGGVAPPAEAECSGTGCQGAPPATPIFATPASVTFDGTGNFPPTETPPPPKCPKNKKLTRGKCVKKVKSKSKGKRAKKMPGRASSPRKKRRAVKVRLGAEK